MKRLLPLFLALTLLFTFLVACQKGSDKTDVSSGNDSESLSDGTDDGLYVADYLPDKTYNGYTLRSISIQDAPQINIFKDSESLSKITVAQYTAIERIKDRFDLEISESYLPTWQNLSESVELMVSSNSDDADFNMLIQREAYRLGIAGYLADWDSLIYCDETQPWYIHGINDQQRVADFDYVNYTWSSTSAYGSAVTCYFNKDMIASLNLDSPYDMVENNTWTVDNWFAMIRSATRDLNNDGTISDVDDQVGLACTRDDAIPTIWMGADYMLVETDEEGIPSFTASNDESFITLLEKITDIQSERALFDYWYVYGASYGGDSRASVISMFVDGKSLFMLRSMNTITSLGATEFDWGAVPVPKRDENQENYVSRVCDVWYTECVPVTCSHLEEASVFIEAYAVESLNHCVDAYYRETLQNRYSDDTAKKMLDIIRDSVVLDLGDTIWQDYCRNTVMNAITAGDKSFVAKFEGVKRLLPTIIDRDLALIEATREERSE